MYVPIGCGNCIECKKKRANEWKVRLFEEIKVNKKNAKFVTLTFSNEELKIICSKINKQESNAVATYAVRHFLELWRANEKKSVKHWLITELGQKNTERIHLHGIIWGDDAKIKKYWKYGQIYIGKYVNEKTINYITKYCTKIDVKHKGYNPIILTSPGIGKKYTKTLAAEIAKKTDKYKTKSGTEIALPIYYRNKIFTEEERENLWLEKLDKNERWVNGVQLKADDFKAIEEQLKAGQERNERLGYGNLETPRTNYNARIIELNELREIKRKAHKEAHSKEEYLKLIKEWKKKKGC